MNKKTLTIVVIALIIIALGAGFFLTRGPESQPSYQPEVKQPFEQKESLIIEQDLLPIELSQEEQQALRDEGIEPLSDEEDKQAKDLQSVRASDEIDAIMADLSETDLSGLDAELEAIEKDLSEL